ncbi:MAG: hypothetical protein AAB074_12640 [Planctomycetota bacterium]
MKTGRNLTWEKKFAKVGVTIKYPAPKTRPHEYVLNHDCGKTWIVKYLALPREARTEYWRCPNGCHKGVTLK